MTIKKRWGVMVMVVTLLSFAPPGITNQLFRPFTDRTEALLDGNWQSCRESDGTYAERMYDGIWPGIPPFELHMGPQYEFALFRGVNEEHRGHDWSVNLLKPWRLEPIKGSAGHRWEVPSLGIIVTAVLAGGSRSDCESWYITITRLKPTS